MVPRYRRHVARTSLTGGLALAAVGLCCYYGTLLMPTIEWTRNADGGWSSDDGALLLLPLAVIAGGLFTYLAWNALRRTAVYATVACGATGATWGWYGSAGDYDIPLPEVAGAVLVAGVVAVGALVLGWWSLIDLRLFYGYPRRGRDREVAVARGYGWERGPDGGGTAVIAFRDRIGTRHDVSAPLPYELRYRPLVAVYDPGTPDDPARLRAGALFVPDERRFEVWRQLKIEFPAPGDDELWEDLHSRDPGIDLAARLRRLSERRRSGDLTAEEFQAGKWRALEEHIASRRSAWPS